MVTKLPEPFQSALDALIRLYNTLHQVRRIGTPNDLDPIFKLLDDESRDLPSSSWCDAANRLNLELTDAKYRLEAISVLIDATLPDSDSICDGVAVPSGCDAIFQLAQSLLNRGIAAAVADWRERPPESLRDAQESCFRKIAEQQGEKRFSEEDWTALKNRIEKEIRKAAAFHALSKVAPRVKQVTKRLIGWPEIFAAIERENTQEARRAFNRYNREYGGPIKTRRGAKPMVDEADFVAWWGVIELRMSEMTQRADDTEAAAAETYQCGRGEAAPLVGGEVKLRKRSKKK